MLERLIVGDILPNMLKTYTIKEKKQKSISSKKASIHYLLEDLEGEERTVIAIAKLGRSQKIKSLQPIYHRETPLVEALADASLNQKIRVDFSAFNEKNPRLSPSQSRIQAKRVLRESGIKQSFLDVSDFSVDPLRLLKLFLIALISFAAFASI